MPDYQELYRKSLDTRIALEKEREELLNDLRDAGAACGHQAGNYCYEYQSYVLARECAGCIHWVWKGATHEN